MKVACVCLVLALLVGCASNPTAPPGPPAPPTPPQITVANAVNALAQAVDGTVKSAIACRDQGKCDPADVRAIENFCASVATAGKKVNATLRSSDPWEKQRIAVLQIVTGSGLATLKSHISPTAQVLVASLTVLVNEISAAVGGPTI